MLLLVVGLTINQRLLQYVRIGIRKLFNGILEASSWTLFRASLFFERVYLFLDVCNIISHKIVR